MLVVVTVSIKIELDENKLIKIGTFSFEMNILYKYFDNQGSHDYLVNRLFNLDPHDFEYFLP